MNDDRPGDIIAYLGIHGTARTKEIARHMDWRGLTPLGVYSATKNELKRLEKAGKVRIVDKTSEGYEWGLVG